MDDSARSSVWADETDWLLYLMALKSARLSLLCIYFRYYFLLTLSSLRCLFTLSNFANLLSPLILPSPAMYPRVPLPLLRDKWCCLHQRADASTFRCVHAPPWRPLFLKTPSANFIIEFPSFFFAYLPTSYPSSLLRLQSADGNAEASHRGIRMEQHTEQISSSIQEMAGPNTILNRTREEAQSKSILIVNDDHHLEHIFRAHCCLDVWLSRGSLIRWTTHWSPVEVTSKQESGGVQQLNSDNLPWKLDHLIFSSSMTCHRRCPPGWSSVELYNYKWMLGTLLQDHFTAIRTLAPHAWHEEARQVGL